MTGSSLGYPWQTGRVSPKSLFIGLLASQWWIPCSVDPRENSDAVQNTYATPNIYSLSIHDTVTTVIKSQFGMGREDSLDWILGSRKIKSMTVLLDHLQAVIGDRELRNQGIEV